MVSSALRRCFGAGIAVACAAMLAGCDTNKNFTLQSLLTFPPPKQAEKAAAPAATPLQQTAAVPPSRELARLHDMKPPEVEALVGDPDFRRVEPPAELWQYRTAACVVDLFFYGEDEQRRVVHEDARSRNPSPVGDRSCGDGSEVLSSRLRG